MGKPMPMGKPRLEVHFEDLEKQAHAARLGMWVFLGSEVLFFGALFGLYASYRVAYGELFRQAAGHTDLALGTVNTFILLTSSFTVAMSIHAARQARPRAATALLALTVVLGAAFLALKGVEYASHFREGIYPGGEYRFEELPEGGARVFFTLYYFMTGLHALHVLGGVGVLAWLAGRARREAFGPLYDTPLELGGLYWHFVDIVWLFLWPLFYLLRESPA